MDKHNYLNRLKNIALHMKDSLIITVLCNVAEETTDYENYTGDSIISEVRYNVEKLTGVKVGRVDVFVDSLMTD